MPARITVYLPDKPAQVLTFWEGREYVIGRDAGCDLVVEDDRVSRRHAVLRSGEAGWELADLGSKNGTLVDGAPAAGCRLGARGWLSLGGLLAGFEQLSDAEGHRQAEERIGRWRTSLELRRRWTPAGDPRQLLANVLDSVLELSGAERGFVLLARADGELEVAATAGLAPVDLATAEFSGSVGAVERVLTTGRAVATSDALAETGLGGRASVLGGGIRALVCVAVTALGRQLGAIYADSRKAGSAFTELDVEILEALASHAALAVAVARMEREIRQLLDSVPARLDLPAEGRHRLQVEIEEARRRALAALPACPAATLAAAAPAGDAEATWSELVAPHRASAVRVAR